MALGPKLTGPLVAILERHDQERMYLVIRLLDDIRPQAEVAAPSLEKLVDRDKQYWDEASCALASVDRQRRRYFAKLMGMYAENEGWPKFVFAIALSYHGPAARAALRTLKSGPGSACIELAIGRGGDLMG